MSVNDVFILGMHRSATSALAGALSHLGIQIVGPDDELYRALDNPNGFFERTSFLDFSKSLKLGLFLTWPIRHLRFSQRTS